MLVCVFVRASTFYDGFLFTSVGVTVSNGQGLNRCYDSVCIVTYNVCTHDSTCTSTTCTCIFTEGMPTNIRRMLPARRNIAHINFDVSTVGIKEVTFTSF